MRPASLLMAAPPLLLPLLLAVLLPGLLPQQSSAVAAQNNKLRIRFKQPVHIVHHWHTSRQQYAQDYGYSAPAASGPRPKRRPPGRAIRPRRPFRGKGRRRWRQGLVRGRRYGMYNYASRYPTWRPRRPRPGTRGNAYSGSTPSKSRLRKRPAPVHKQRPVDDVDDEEDYADEYSNVGGNDLRAQSPDFGLIHEEFQHELQHNLRDRPRYEPEYEEDASDDYDDYDGAESAVTPRAQRRPDSKKIRGPNPGQTQSQRPRQRPLKGQGQGDGFGQGQGQRTRTRQRPRQGQNERQSDRYNEKQSDRYKERQSDRYNERQSDRYNEKQSDRYNERQSDRYNERQSDKYNDRQSERQSERDRERDRDSQGQRRKKKPPRRAFVTAPSATNAHHTVTPAPRQPSIFKQDSDVRTKATSHQSNIRLNHQQNLQSNHQQNLQPNHQQNFQPNHQQNLQPSPEFEFSRLPVGDHPGTAPPAPPPLAQAPLGHFGHHPSAPGGGQRFHPSAPGLGHHPSAPGHHPSAPGHHQPSGAAFAHHPNALHHEVPFTHRPLFNALQVGRPQPQLAHASPTPHPEHHDRHPEHQRLPNQRSENEQNARLPAPPHSEHPGTAPPAPDPPLQSVRGHDSSPAEAGFGQPHFIHNGEQFFGPLHPDHPLLQNQPQPKHEPLHQPRLNHEPPHHPRPDHEPRHQLRPNHEPPHHPRPDHEHLHQPRPNYEPLHHPRPDHEPHHQPRPNHEPLRHPRPEHEHLHHPRPDNEPLHHPRADHEHPLQPRPDHGPLPHPRPDHESRHQARPNHEPHHQPRPNHEHLHQLQPHEQHHHHRPQPSPPPPQHRPIELHDEFSARLPVPPNAEYSGTAHPASLQGNRPLIELDHGPEPRPVPKEPLQLKPVEGFGERPNVDRPEDAPPALRLLHIRAGGHLQHHTVHRPEETGGDHPNAIPNDFQFAHAHQTLHVDRQKPQASTAPLKLRPVDPSEHSDFRNRILAAEHFTGTSSSPHHNPFFVFHNVRGGEGENHGDHATANSQQISHSSPGLPNEIRSKTPFSYVFNSLHFPQQTQANAQSPQHAALQQPLKLKPVNLDNIQDARHFGVHRPGRVLPASPPHSAGPIGSFDHNPNFVTHQVVSPDHPSNIVIHQIVTPDHHPNTVPLQAVTPDNHPSTVTHQVVTAHHQVYNSDQRAPNFEQGRDGFHHHIPDQNENIFTPHIVSQGALVQQANAPELQLNALRSTLHLRFNAQEGRYAPEHLVEPPRDPSKDIAVQSTALAHQSTALAHQSTALAHQSTALAHQSTVLAHQSSSQAQRPESPGHPSSSLDVGQSHHSGPSDGGQGESDAPQRDAKPPYTQIINALQVEITTPSPVNFHGGGFPLEPAHHFTQASAAAFPAPSFAAAPPQQQQQQQRPAFGPGAVPFARGPDGVPYVEVTTPTPLQPALLQNLGDPDATRLRIALPPPSPGPDHDIGFGEGLEDLHEGIYSRHPTGF